MDRLGQYAPVACYGGDGGSVVLYDEGWKVVAHGSSSCLKKMGPRCGQEAVL